MSFAVCVYLASSNAIDPRYFELATEMGQGIAKRDWSLVTGGGSVGMMGAVGRACRAAGGRTLGVIPQALVDMEVADHDSDELVVVDTMRQRKAIMDDRADAFVALPGGLGTLEELMEVWTARTLGMHSKPIVVCDPWGDYDQLRAQVQMWATQGFVRQAALEALTWATSVPEALDAVAQQTAVLGDKHDAIRP